MTLLGTEVAAPGGRPVSWFAIDKALMEKLPGLKPWECDRFTLAEIEYVLAEPEEALHDGAPDMSDADILAHAQRWEALTPVERLREAAR